MGRSLRLRSGAALSYPAARFPGQAPMRRGMPAGPRLGQFSPFIKYLRFVTAFTAKPAHGPIST